MVHNDTIDEMKTLGREYEKMKKVYDRIITKQWILLDDEEEIVAAKDHLEQVRIAYDELLYIIDHDARFADSVEGAGIRFYQEEYYNMLKEERTAVKYGFLMTNRLQVNLLQSIANSLKNKEITDIEEEDLKTKTEKITEQRFVVIVEKMRLNALENSYFLQDNEPLKYKEDKEKRFAEGTIKLYIEAGKINRIEEFIWTSCQMLDLEEFDKTSVSSDCFKEIITRDNIEKYKENLS